SGWLSRQCICVGLWPARAIAAPRTAVLSGLSGGHESGAPGSRCIFFPCLLGIHVAHVLGVGAVTSPGREQSARRLCLHTHGEPRHLRTAARFRSFGGFGRTLCLRDDARPKPSAILCFTGVVTGTSGCRFEGRS